MHYTHTHTHIHIYIYVYIYIYICITKVYEDSQGRLLYDPAAGRSLSEVSRLWPQHTCSATLLHVLRSFGYVPLLGGFFGRWAIPSPSSKSSPPVHVTGRGWPRHNMSGTKRSYVATNRLAAWPGTPAHSACISALLLVDCLRHSKSDN